MKRLCVLTSILLMVCLAFQVSEAQNRKAGINAAAFLKIGVGARQVGLGSAVTAVSGDVNNMYWNPAGIALTKDQSLQASFTHSQVPRRPRPISLRGCAKPGGPNRPAKRRRGPYPSPTKSSQAHLPHRLAKVNWLRPISPTGCRTSRLRARMVLVQMRAAHPTS